MTLMSRALRIAISSAISKRASCFRAGGTESSRSRITASISVRAVFLTHSILWAGKNSSERSGQVDDGITLRVSGPWTLHHQAACFGHGGGELTVVCQPHDGKLNFKQIADGVSNCLHCIQSVKLIKTTRCINRSILALAFIKCKLFNWRRNFVMLG